MTLFCEEREDFSAGPPPSCCALRGAPAVSGLEKAPLVQPPQGITHALGEICCSLLPAGLRVQDSPLHSAGVALLELKSPKRKPVASSSSSGVICGLSCYWGSRTMNSAGQAAMHPDPASPLGQLQSEGSATLRHLWGLLPQSIYVIQDDFHNHWLILLKYEAKSPVWHSSPNQEHNSTHTCSGEKSGVSSEAVWQQFAEAFYFTCSLLVAIQEYFEPSRRHP